MSKKRRKGGSLVRVPVRSPDRRAEYALWGRKISTNFAGCKMLGRTPQIYYPGWIYVFDIGSRFELVGVLHADGACMVVPDDILHEDKFEKGNFRVPRFLKRAKKGITITEGRQMGRVVLRPKEKASGGGKRIRPKTTRTR